MNIDDSREGIAAVMALVKAKPRTVEQLVTLSDVSPASVAKWLQALELEFLVRRRPREDQGAHVWEWVK